MWKILRNGDGFISESILPVACWYIFWIFLNEFIRNNFFTKFNLKFFSTGFSTTPSLLIPLKNPIKIFFWENSMQKKRRRSKNFIRLTLLDAYLSFFFNFYSLSSRRRHSFSLFSPLALSLALSTQFNFSNSLAKPEKKTENIAEKLKKNLFEHNSKWIFFVL